MQIEGMTEELAQRLVEQGYLSYDDLSVIENIEFGLKALAKVVQVGQHGSEVAVLDEKEAWLQVADETHRAGWVRKDQVLIIGRAPATRPVVASTPSR